MLLRILLCTFGLTDASEKIWQRNTNFKNTGNWHGGQVPCATDRAVFPWGLQFSVELPDGTTELGELVLPSSGTIVMPVSGGALVLNEARISASCKGEAVFSRTQVAYWTDPQNWAGSTQATPHLENIPCRYDTAVFPPSSTFSLALPHSATITVAKLQIGQQENSGLPRDLGMTEWEEFLSSDEGRRQMESPAGHTTVRIEGGECTDPAGCECGTQDVKDEVCSLVQCEVPRCFSPVQPTGHCCSICGAVLVYGFKSPPFRITDLMMRLERWLQSEEVSGQVSIHASRVGEFLVQVVLTETSAYQALVPGLATQLNNFLMTEGGLGLWVHALYLAGGVYYPVSFGSKVTSFLGTLLAVLVVFAMLFIYHYHPSSWRLPRLGEAFTGESPPFLFARFENLSGEVELVSEALCEGGLAEQRERGSADSKAFHNPMYAAVQPRSEGVLHGNPVFSELKLSNSPSASEDDEDN